jgi:PAS domain S-box-containing protein
MALETPVDDAGRLAAIAALDMVELQPLFDRVGRLARAHARMDADVVLVGNQRTWRIGKDTDWVHSGGSATSFTGAALASDEVMWVEDTLATPCWRDNPDVATDNGLRFFAGAPIRLANGHRIGVVCIADQAPHAYDPDLVAYLTDLAAIAANECDRCLARRHLAQATTDAVQAHNLVAAFVEAAPVAICMTDREMRVIQASPRWRQERQQPDIAGRVLYEAYPDTRRWSETYDHCLTGESIQRDRVQISLPDGSQRWVRVEIAPWRDATGEVGGLLVMSIDVTATVEALDEAKHAADRLKLALEIGELQMWEMDFQRREVSAAGVEPSMPRTYEELNRDFWVGVHPDERDAAMTAWDAYAAGGPAFRQTYRILRPDGPYQWHHSAVHALRDDQNRIIRLVGVLRNVDAQKRGELELRQAMETAETANKAKSEFLANMSHEIRTPLNGVMGIAGALARTELGAQQAEMVGLIETSAQTLEALLTDILDLARIEAGRLEIRPEPFDLATSVNACAALFQASAEAKDLALKVEIEPYALGAYQGDAPRIRQILSNLLGNAVKFTARGEVRLSVQARRDETTTHMIFEVADTGIGFDEETRARLFGRFEQADGSITRKYGGTGLGLAISSSLAEAMGGELVADSTPGQGSVFRLTLELPRRTGAVEMWGDHEAALEEEADLQAMRVLLAEDHPTNRRVVELILGAAGVDLTSVENGAEAVDLAARSRFDLILMDMQMPVMDGLTAIRAIRRREARNGEPATPIYTLTANAMPEHAQASSAAGADGHITKPITADGLLRVVEQVWCEQHPPATTATASPAARTA